MCHRSELEISQRIPLPPLYFGMTKSQCSGTCTKSQDVGSWPHHGVTLPCLRFSTTLFYHCLSKASFSFIRFIYFHCAEVSISPSLSPLLGYHVSFAHYRFLGEHMQHVFKTH